jgi:bromodomain-containing factor 1
MASPNPDAPAADSPSRDVTTEKEQKSEVNGHATPEKSADAPESTTVNGNDKTEDHPVENGVSKDVEMADSDEKKASPSPPKDDAADVKDKSDSADQAKELSDKESGEPKAAEDEPTVASEDVDMADASPADKTQDDKPAQDVSAEVPVEEDAKDVDMTEKSSDAPEKADATDDKATTSKDAVAAASEADDQPPSTDSNDADAPKPSTEVSMQDAPAPDASGSSKVAREREEDSADEPAPKRAKTEPKSEEPADAMAPAPKTETAPNESAPEQEMSRFSGLERWNDTKFKEQKLTAHQRREFRKVLGRVKKTKSGGHFKDSVPKLWPTLADSYLAKIEKPTDLSEIDRTLRDAVYTTIGDFQNDLVLMYDNTQTFNGTLHEVTTAAFNAIRDIWENIILIPAEEAVKPKSAPKPKPPREPRISSLGDSVARKPSVGPGTSPAAESVSSKPRHGSQEVAAAAAAASELRRASNATEGDRPKRTVRAPKSKDIDYTTKPSRKKLKPELQFSEEVLGEMMHPKNTALNSWFMDPVDAEGLNIPHYYSIIKKPMDLNKISRMLKNGDITSVKDFDKNVRLIFTNCYTFNGSVDQGNSVSYVASQLEGYYNKLMKDKDAWLARYAKANAPAPGSDDEDEDDDEVEGIEPAGPPGADPTKEVRDLEAKLREESGKLTDLFAAEMPNESMISIQQTIVSVVQDSLLKAKQALSQYRSKNQDKPAKKAAKPSKPKPSGSVPRKPSGNVPHPKKPSGTKKAGTKKTLTAADKDAIASAINDLDGAQLDRAIDIIKRDTGQNVSNNDLPRHRVMLTCL